MMPIMKHLKNKRRQMQSLLSIMGSVNNGEQKREIAKRLIEEGIYEA
jgi:hypothetical protein